jgi:chromosome segregation ATPase
MPTKKPRNSNDPSDPAVAVGGVALVASILGNLAQHSNNQDLQHQVEALQQIVADWQVAYRSLENQLTLALDTNASLNDQVSNLRNELRSAQERVYVVEQRALEAEERLRGRRRGR